jgi:3-oxoadipate enol-lactonase
MATVEHSGVTINTSESDLRLPWRRGTKSVVFHHGLGACADIWLGWLGALSDRYRTVRFDMRGHGTSQGQRSAQSLDLATLLGDLDAVISSTGEDPVHLVGESIGGTIALAYAVTWPEKVSTLTISNGAHRGGSLQNLADWSDLIETDGMAGWSKMMMGRRFYPGALGKDAAGWFETQQSTADPDVMLRALKILVGADLGDELRRATMPTLLLHPDASPFIPVELAAELAAKLPNARLKVFPHTKHGLPFSHAGDCARTLATFLAEHE